MFRFLAFLLAFVGASAFMRSGRTSRSISMMAEKSKAIPFLDKPKNLDGMVGDKGFDPIGFSDFLDVRFLREAELKHGRTAMLGFLGFVGSEFFKLPDHNYGPIAAHDIAVSNGAMAQILCAVTALEFVSIVAIKQMLAGSGRAPGDYGFDPLGMSSKGSAKDKETMQLKELENGRLAMLAFGGVITQAVITGAPFPYTN